MIARTTVAATALACAATALGAGAARAVDVSERVTMPGEPAAVWARVGGRAIADWHPAVTGCAMGGEGGAVRRALGLEGGGTLLKERPSRGEASYGHAILERPLPVAGYAAEIAAEPGEGGTTITGSGSFEASGAAEAEAVIRGIRRAGLDAIAARGG